MTEFASLDGQNQNIPFNGASVDPMTLTTPNSMITGTMAGLQQIGSPSLTVDSVKNLITVKPISTANTQILRYGQVATGYLGMAVNDGTNDTMFAGRDNTGATVVKIAKTGFDAKTASAVNLIFNSSQDMFKIVTKLTGSIPSFSYSNSFGRTSITIPHGQSFTPILQIYVQGALLNSSLSLIASSYVPLPISPGGSNITGKYYFSNGASNYYPLGIAFSVDSTNIIIQAETNGSQSGSDTIAAIPYTIFVLQETAT